jgi:AcrR family transcriptional regulator
MPVPYWNRHFENFDFPLDKSKNLVYIQNIVSKRRFELCKGGFQVAKQIEGVYDAVLACAKEEFLDKGYQEASLRTIAQKAGTSTGSIYTRFGDKEGLFEAIVQPAVTGIMALVCEVQETFHSFDSETQKQQVNQYSFSEMQRAVDYMYDHFDEFCLLLDSAHGTRFRNFVDELAQVEVDYTFKFLEAVGCPIVQELPAARELLHIVSTSYFEGVFEVIRHRMDRETAGRYVEQLERYNAAGFEALFFPHQ